MNIVRVSLKSRIALCTTSIRNQCSSIERTYTEVSIPVPWGHVAGKWWGPTDKRPILSLHGWQDNCGSFNTLIPLLNKDVGFLAIDLPGHGYSSRIPNGMYYHHLLYITVIKYIQRYFKWHKLSLMGHSLGGITSYCYTMLYPQEIDFLICLDGAKPLIIPQRNKYIAQNIDKFVGYNKYMLENKDPPSYTLEEIKKKVCAPNKNSINYDVSYHIVERNVAQSKSHPGKYYFSRDPRLKVGAMANYCQDELLDSAQKITCPIFIVKTKGGSYYEDKENFYQVLDVLKRSSSDCDFHYVEGTHHSHLNNPENVAPLINKFIQRHDVEGRSEGGIKNSIIRST